MLTYTLWRLVQTVPVLIVSSIFVFLIVHLLPGDAAVVVAGPEATDETVEAIRARMGLDQPLYVQYWIWITDVIRGDLGDSYINRLPASELIASRLPATLVLGVSAFLVTVVLSVPLGVLAALREGKITDWLVSTVGAFVIAVPNFWVGILLILLFALHLGWLPPGGYVGFEHDPALALRSLILPTLALASSSIFHVARFVRSALLDTLGDDFVRTARAKGVPARRVLTRHAIRNALIPVVTMLGITLGGMLSGAVVIESVFAWPGLGRLLVQSILNQDFTVVQGVLLLMVLLFVVVNLVVDLLYSVLDPRIQVAGERAR